MQAIHTIIPKSYQRTSCPFPTKIHYQGLGHSKYQLALNRPDRPPTSQRHIPSYSKRALPSNTSLRFQKYLSTNTLERRRKEECRPELRCRRKSMPFYNQSTPLGSTTNHHSEPGTQKYMDRNHIDDRNALKVRPNITEMPEARPAVPARSLWDDTPPRKANHRLPTKTDL